MEGATIQSLDMNAVNVNAVFQGLVDISRKYRLLNEKVIDYVTLESLTKDMILESYANSEENYVLTIDLLDLWFPALTETIDSWSHCHDIDLDVETLLSDAGYPADTEDDS